jgi:hypothetical protein
MSTHRVSRTRVRRITSRAQRSRAWILAGFVVALGLVACKSEGETRASRVVPPAELPEDLRATWEIERERVIADPARLRFVVDNLVIEMVRAYERSRLTTPGQVEGPFERAQRELVLMPAGSTPVLVELLAVKDGIVAFLAADVLQKIGAPALDGVTQKLASETPEVRRRSAELLAKLPQGGAREPAIHEALGALVKSDEQWIVRAQAAETLGVRGARHDHKGYCLAVLSRALQDPDPAVVTSACAALATLAEPRAIPVLIQALERRAASGDLKGVRAAQEALRSLSGVERDLGPAEWASWWRDQGRSAKPAGH